MKKISVLFIVLILSISSFAKEIDGDIIPPVPDETLNNSTIAGVDSDNDGVRDDVELWINANFPESADLRKAFKQMSRSYQQALIEAEDKELSIQNKNRFGEALNCAFERGGKGDVNFNRIDMMRKNFKFQMLNTKERILANIKFNDQLAGTGTPPRVRELRDQKRPLTELCE